MTEIEWAAVPFRKSSFSTTNGGQCVEVGAQSGVIGVRDSKCPAGGVIAVPVNAWTTFMRVARR